MKFFKIIFLFSFSLHSVANVFQIDLWPEEGRPVLKAKSTRLSLRNEPNLQAKIISNITVSIGATIKFNNTKYKTIKAGNIIALKDVTLRGRVIGNLKSLSKEQYYSNAFESDSFVVTQGTNIEFLQYRAEGTCFICISGVVIDAEECPAGHLGTFKITRKPLTEWWIHATINNNQGWLLVGGNEIELDGRTY